MATRIGGDVIAAVRYGATVKALPRHAGSWVMDPVGASTAAVRAGAIPRPRARSLTGQAGSAFNVEHLNDVVAGSDIVWGPPHVWPNGAVSTSAGRRLLDIEAAPVIGIRVVDAARSWGIELHPQVGRIG